MKDTILVAKVDAPTARYRISQEEFDGINASAEEAGQDSPFIVQEEGCEGGQSYDQLTAAGKKQVETNQVKRQAILDAEAE